MLNVKNMKLVSLIKLKTVYLTCVTYHKKKDNDLGADLTSILESIL